MTKAEKAHLARLAEMPCLLCNELGLVTHGVEIHHLRTGAGMSQRSSHWLTIPLCPACHREGNGIHGNRSLMKIAKVSELDLLAECIRRLEE